MVFQAGSTRFVLLVRDIAIKVARPMIIPRLRSKKQLDWARFCQIVQHAAVDGIIANLEEASCSKTTEDARLARTIFCFLGIINIQRRGTQIEAKDLGKAPFREYAHLHKDLCKIEHFGWIDGRICYLDYGCKLVNDIVFNREAVSEHKLAF